MVQPVTTYQVDPHDPRAPAQEVWDRLGPAQRQRVLDALPSEIDRVAPPEGDAHSIPKLLARQTLEEHFRRIGRRAYLASELPVYYPGEPMFAPDLLAVLDTEPQERDHWTVSHEGRGLDVVLEIHVHGSAAKDFEDNVARYAALGIPEYFAYAPRRQRLVGWRLASAGARTYDPIAPHEGRWRSALLGLDLALEDGRLRFYHGSAALLDATELIARLGAMADAATRRAEQEAQRAERYAARLQQAGIDPDEID